MSLLPSIFRRREPERLRSMDFDELVSYFQYNGIGYPFMQQTAPGQVEEQIAPDFVGLARGTYGACTPVFACELLRMSVFSEARFQWQAMSGGRPGALFGTSDLQILETPWPNGTTGDLLTRAILDADLAGNFMAVRRPNRTIRRLRPDWVTMVLGSNEDPDVAPYDVDAEVVAYIFQPALPAGGTKRTVFMAEEVAHFMPVPDPEAPYRGMSWLRPVVREVMGDKAATKHKLRFFEKGGTPNMVVKLAIKDENVFNRWVEKFREENEGVANAYKTLFLTAGADVEVVGKDLQQMDFKVTQGGGETRIAAAAGTPPVLVGLSEGLAASTYNNYPAARRRFADGTMRPLWRNLAASLEKLIPTRPSGARLWYDDRDIPFLKDDQQDTAVIMQARATAIRTLTDAGFEPASVVAAIDANDISLLRHTGLYSVQLQPPGSSAAPPPSANGSAPVQSALAALEAGRSYITALEAGERGDDSGLAP